MCKKVRPSTTQLLQKPTAVKKKTSTKKINSNKDKLELKDCTKKRKLLWVVYSGNKRPLKKIVWGWH